MKTFGQKVIDYHYSLRPGWVVPDGIELLYPYSNEAVRHSFSAFYNRYFNDHHTRTFIFGINPGRFGAGVTGIAFTDPVALETIGNIPNDFEKKRELSSIFMYQLIDALGGVESFYNRYYITSTCPLGFTKDRKNYNYYDDRKLSSAVHPHIVDNLLTQQSFGANPSVAFSLGKGQNFDYLMEINRQYALFDKIISLPHPRWVMQYQSNDKDRYIDQCASLLTQS